MRRIAFAAVAALLGSAPAAQALSAIEFDGGGRMVANIAINGQGPFRFIVDTGANRTVVSASLARRLGLAVDNEIAIQGTAGASRAATVRLDHMRGEEFERTNIAAVVMSGGMLADTDGLIGMDEFRGKRLHFHVNDRAFEIGEGGAAAPAGYARVSGRIRFGSLLEVPVEVGGVRARALIDTGSEVSLINDALIAALGLQPGAPGEFDVVGAGAEQGSFRVRVHNVKLGQVAIASIDLYRAELPHARTNTGEEAPALILGMDMWRRMRAMAIDLERAELQFLPGWEGARARGG